MNDRRFQRRSRHNLTKPTLIGTEIGSALTAIHLIATANSVESSMHFAKPLHENGIVVEHFCDIAAESFLCCEHQNFSVTSFANVTYARKIDIFRLAQFRQSP